MASIDQLLKGLKKLPAIPVAVTQLISNLCNSDDGPDSEPTSKIVRRDSALSASVLRVANSAALGFQLPANSITEALSRVGENQLLKIALAHASQAALGGPVEEYGLEEGEAWMGALAGALAAEELARVSGLCDPNVAFTGGLLRDIGKLAMGLLVPDGGVELVLTQGESEVTRRERDAWGFDHTQVGAALGRSWGLPDELVNAIRFHHDPPGEDLGDPLFDVVHCADVLTMLLGYGIGHDGMRYQLNAASKERLQLDQHDLEIVLAKVRLRMDEFLGSQAA
ncbi:MAG: HDOD domain-containing protein [Planctomycetota bacterium]|nr:HDOD domain-containing protein [Planctomycetota bacterium]